MLRASLLCLLLATALDLRADLYVSGFNSGGVYRFDQSTGAAIGNGVFIAPGAGGLILPHGIMRLADGSFIVASAGNDSVLRYSRDGIPLSTFIANGQNGMPAGTLDYPVDFALGPDGDLFITSQLNDRVVRVNALTGAFVGVFIAAGSIDGPSGLAWHPGTGHLYVVGRFGNHVNAYDSIGALVPGFVSNGFNQPFGIAAHPTTDDIFAVNGGANSVRRLHPGTGATLGTVSGGLGFPIGVRFGPGGDMFVANFGANRIARFDGTAGNTETDLVTTATASAVGLDGPNFFQFIAAFTAQEEWRLGHFGIATAAGDAADAADPDFDGFNNLLEFLTGSSPVASSVLAQQITVENDDLRFVYSRNAVAVADGWQFEVEWNDMPTANGWETAAVTETVLATVGNVETVQAEFSAGAAARRFLRLRMER